MTEHKFTDEEIKKALECCTHSCAACKECPYTDEKWCVHELTKDALDLINRQQAEIERLKDHNKQLRYDRKKITNEAIKEFAERLKDAVKYNPDEYLGIQYEIDVLVKEMTEGQK